MVNSSLVLLKAPKAFGTTAFPEALPESCAIPSMLQRKSHPTDIRTPVSSSPGAHVNSR
jgi:hypothetical protein